MMWGGMTVTLTQRDMNLDAVLRTGSLIPSLQRLISDLQGIDSAEVCRGPQMLYLQGLVRTGGQCRFSLRGQNRSWLLRMCFDACTCTHSRLVSQLLTGLCVLAIAGAASIRSLQMACTDEAVAALCV